MSDANPKEEVRSRPDRRKEEWTSPRAYPWREHATDDGFKLVLYGDSVWLMDDSCCNVQAAINCKLFTKPQLSGGGVITAVYCGVAHFAVEAGTAGEWSQKLGWDWTRWIREWEGSSGAHLPPRSTVRRDYFWRTVGYWVKYLFTRTQVGKTRYVMLYLESSYF